MLQSIKRPFLTVCRYLFDSSHVPRPGDRYQRHLRKTNYGYKLNFHVKGEPLPRMEGCMTPVAGENLRPDFSRRTKHWNVDEMLLGQNDYIDLLGNGSVHPAQLLYHVPPWLRGFPGDHRANELIRLIHYRNLYSTKLKRNSPGRWHDLMKRLHYLLKYHNYRKQDELRLERKLGLWRDGPDYFYKDNEKRTYKDIP